MNDDLAGRTAIVTGAANGVGRAAALRFARAGANVMLAGADDAGLRALEAEIAEEGGQAARFHFDHRDRLSAANLAAATFDAFGGLHILVTDSRASRPAAFLDLETADLRDVLEQNLLGAFLLGKVAARRMAAQAEEDPDYRGAIVNITSIAAERAAPELLAYSVSCAALDQLTRSMASSLAAHRVRVNGIALGAVLTDSMLAHLREDEEMRGALVGVTPLGRVGEPEEAAEAALFLASDRASFVTGQILAVDGGRLLLDPFASPLR